jgi:hypothetical protein
MKTRRVFSTPDLPAAQAAIQTARQAGVADEDVFLVARSDIALEKIPDERQRADSDFYPSALRGVASGGAVGLLAGLVAVAVPPLGVTLAGAGAMTLAGALVGGWSGALAGAAAPDPVRQKFEGEIEAGRILVVVDGDKERLPQAEAALRSVGATPLPFEAPSALG